MEFKHSKFMNVKYHYVRKVLADEILNVWYVKSSDNIADIFTKRLPHGPLSNLRGRFMRRLDQRNLPVEQEIISPTLNLYKSNN